MLSTLRDEVDLRTAAGLPLARIEAEVVDGAPVDEERRAALWLYAWLRTGGAPTGRAPRLLDFAA